MSELINLTEDKITAEQIEQNCPDNLQRWGKHIAAHLEKAHKCEDKADQHYTSIGQYLAKAKETCDEGGFAAFHEKFCPNLGRTRAYELLAVGQNKKSLEDFRAGNRERAAKHRAKKSAEAQSENCSVRYVMDTSQPLPGPQDASDPADDTSAQPGSQPSKPRRSVTRIGNLLTDLATLKSKSSRTAPPVGNDIPPDKSSENMKVMHAANDDEQAAA